MERTTPRRGCSASASASDPARRPPMRLHRNLAVAAALLALPGAALAQGGGVDFSRYVALGDSLTAGFQSGGLAQTGQRGSYPRILHELATGNDAFQQPLVS